jgi:hypothetical protein
MCCNLYIFISYRHGTFSWQHPITNHNSENLPFETILNIERSSAFSASNGSFTEQSSRYTPTKILHFHYNVSVWYCYLLFWIDIMPFSFIMSIIHMANFHPWRHSELPLNTCIWYCSCLLPHTCSPLLGGCCFQISWLLVFMISKWLRHYATSRKVTSSRPDEVNEFFNLPNPSSHTIH